jgi:uncharacterized membrane protein (UPF0127 family)
VRFAAVLLAALFLVGCSGVGSGDDPGPDGDARGSRTTAQPSETAGRGTQPASSAPELPTVIINASNGEEVKVRVEIADNPLEMVIGLRNRESLPENRGMLFVHTEEDKLSYTMDDTLISLSIAFMDSEGRIIDIQDMKPLTDGPYVSAEPAQYALEVNQSFFEEHGVKVGDSAELPE